LFALPALGMINGARGAATPEAFNALLHPSGEFAARFLIVADAATFEMWTGWIAFAIFLPLAATSTNYAVRLLGPRWKAVQRWTYSAAVLTLLHWASLHDWGAIAPALVNFGPLIALTAYRLWWNFLRPRSLAQA